MNKSQGIPEAEQVGGLAPPHIKMYSKVQSLAWYEGRNGQVDQWNRTKNQALTLVYDRVGTADHWKKEGPFLISGAGTIGYP